MTEQEIKSQNSQVPLNQSTQERNWAVFCHLSAFVGFLGIPLGNILGPLIIWAIKKNEMPLVDEVGKEALNFQISMTIYCLAAFLLMFVFIGFLLIFPLILVDAILVVIAAIKTSNGEEYKYPITIRFLK